MSRLTRTEMKPQEITYATSCDACGKVADGYGPNGWLRFSSHHSDWGNDSIDSHEYWDVCSFACYLTKVRAVVDDYGEGRTLVVDEKDIEFVRDMLSSADDVAALREAIRQIGSAWAFGEDAEIATAIGAAWNLAGLREE